MSGEVIGFTGRRASHAEYVVVEAQNLTAEPIGSIAVQLARRLERR